MIDAPVDAIDLAARTVPTDAPEADGTLSWDPTTASGRSLAVRRKLAERLLADRGRGASRQMRGGDREGC